MDEKSISAKIHSKPRLDDLTQGPAKHVTGQDMVESRPLRSREGGVSQVSLHSIMLFLVILVMIIACVVFPPLLLIVIPAGVIAILKK